MTLRFDNLLEGHTELRKDVIPMVMVHYRERLEVEIGQGDRCVEWGPGEARHALPVVHTQGSRVDSMYFPQPDTLSLGDQGFCEGLSRRHGVIL